MAITRERIPTDDEINMVRRTVLAELRKEENIQKLELGLIDWELYKYEDKTQFELRDLVSGGAITIDIDDMFELGIVFSNLKKIFKEQMEIEKCL